jgi:hypothetical protein
MDKDEVGDAKKIFEDIVTAESYLAPLRALFDSLFGFPGRKIKSFVRELDIPLSEIRDARDAFCDLRYSSPTAQERAMLYRGLSFESPERLVTSLVDVHHDVSKSRERPPWLNLDEGTVTILVPQPPLANPQLSPRRAWSNHYYLTTLLGIAKGLGLDG